MLRVERHGDVVFFRTARAILGRPVFWGGAYLVDGLLVDCGPPATDRELAAALGQERLVGLALTHHHEDHMGGAALLRRRHGLTPQIHACGVPLVQRGFRVEPYRRVAWGSPDGVDAQPLGSEVRGRSLRFEVVHTPGHSPDHVCLFERERGWLFSGDLFLAERLRFLRRDEDLDLLIRSLRSVVALPLREVFCAHRGRVRDGPAALRRKLAHLEALRERILELLAKGLPEAEVTRRAVGHEGTLTWISLGHFSARNFVRAVLRGTPAR